MSAKPGRTRPIVISTLITVSVAILAVLVWAGLPDAGNEGNQGSAGAPPSTVTVTVTPPPAPTTGAGSIPPPAEICDPLLFRRHGHDFVDGLLYCDAGWARGGTAQSDNVGVFHWVGDAWVQLPRAGESPVTGYPCYDSAAMRRDGAPEELLLVVPDCADLGD